MASRAHLDLLNPVIARAIVEAGVDEQRIDAVACTIGPGLIGALLVGVSAAKALALAWDVPVRRGQPPRGAPLRVAPRRSRPSSSPIVVLLVSGGHTMLVEMRGARRLPPARPDDRRRRRRGVRQGGALPRPRVPGRAGDRARRIVGRPGGDRVPPGDAQRRSRLQLLGAQDGGGQLRAQAPRRSAWPTWRRRSSRRWSTCSSQKARRAAAACRREGDRPRRRRGRQPHVAARRWWRAAPRTGCGRYVPSPEMCTDNAAMIAAAGWHRLRLDGPTPLDEGAHPNLRLVV